jgi:hypothetical protein
MLRATPAENGSSVYHFSGTDKPAVCRSAISVAHRNWPISPFLYEGVCFGFDADPGVSVYLLTSSKWDFLILSPKFAILLATNPTGGWAFIAT